MNKTEQSYANFLDVCKAEGRVLHWEFEKIKLKLADNTFYTPDFLVITKDRLELHEVKGFWEEDARVKIKVAAEQFWWFAFVAVKKDGKRAWNWEIEVF